VAKRIRVKVHLPTPTGQLAMTKRCQTKTQLCNNHRYDRFVATQKASLLKLTMTLAVGMILAVIAATSLPFPDRDRAFRRFRTALSLLAAAHLSQIAEKKATEGRYYKSQDFKYEKKNAGALR